MREVSAARAARVRRAHERRAAGGAGARAERANRENVVIAQIESPARDRERRRDRRRARGRRGLAGAVRPDARARHPRPVRPSEYRAAVERLVAACRRQRKAARPADRHGRRRRRAARAGLRRARLRRRVGVRAGAARARGRAARRAREPGSSADALGPARAAALFNAGFSGYLVPMQLDEAALREHVEENDIDLRDSRVVVAGRPAAFACSGCAGPTPGSAAWPRSRTSAGRPRRARPGRHPRGGRRSAAAGPVGLEVVDDNRAAIALYAKLGFAVVRDLACGRSGRRIRRGGSAGRSMSARPRPGSRRTARATSRGSAPMRCSAGCAGAGRRCTGWSSSGTGSIRPRSSTATVRRRHRAAGRRGRCAAAADALRAAAAGEREIRFTNAPTNEPFSQALEQLGGRLVARQHEMRLGL